MRPRIEKRYRKLTPEELDAFIDYLIARAPRTGTLDVDPDTGRLRLTLPKVQKEHETH